MDLFNILLLIWTLRAIQGSPIDVGGQRPEIFVNSREESGTGETQAPWKINKGICPPALCGPDAGPVAGGGSDEGDSTPTLASPLHVSKDVLTESAGAFPFFEGDIVLDVEIAAMMSKAKQKAQAERTQNEGTRRDRRSIVRPLSRRWKYAIIPYVMDSMFSSEMKGLIEEAMFHIQNHTCITFQPRNTTTDEDYIFFINEPGCWSFVGRHGGVQYVSLGSGCEYFGTVVHEMAHAIGFWHEQSRSDRDVYVELIRENISPSADDQFGVRHSTESTSRGFAYDYGSIMHYGTHYFSRNGRPTLKVIGPGRELGLNVGQRKELSDLDIAQLKDMYHCNQRADEIRGCKEGWKRFRQSCYLFVTLQKKNYEDTLQSCYRKGAYPLHINCETEDDFIKRYLIKHHPNDTIWRTGGRLSSGQWVWQKKGRFRPIKEKVMNYTNWPTNQPGSYKTLTLQKLMGTYPTFMWRGAWVGNQRTPSRYAHSYICERKIKVKCIKSRRNGRNYRGKLSYTTSGTTCQKWTSQYPHRHKYLLGNRKSSDVIESGLGDHNYCRNPEGEKERPWCYTTKSHTRWQYCDVKICKEEA